MQMGLINTELTITVLLLIAAFVSWFTKRVNFPYTVGLVLVGVLITLLLPNKPELAPHVARELILLLLLPPLVFEAALHIEFSEFRDNLFSMLMFAVPGVLVTTILVGWLLAVITGLPLSTMLVFGALIAATDPVAVTAIFRELGLPKRLGLLTEGESLLNDATAIVVFSLLLEFAIDPSNFSFANGVIEFLRVSGLGLLVGFVSGYIAYKLIRQIDDYLVETVLSAVVAYGSYLVAEQLHASGVLAVLVAGLLIGNSGRRYGMSHTTRNVLLHIWEFVVFIANTFVFLLIGLQVNLEKIFDSSLLIGIAVIMTLVARIITVFGLSPIINRFAPNKTPLSWQAVLVWGGLRGGIALALVLALPENFVGYDEVLVMTFGVVLFTLGVQATTLPLLLRRLGLLNGNKNLTEYERRRARLAAAKSSEEFLQSQYAEGLVTKQIYEVLVSEVQVEIKKFSGDVEEALIMLPDIRDDELEIVRKEILQVKRDTLRILRHDGIIGTDVFTELTTEIDVDLSAH
tara:strand:- start:2850 stop:4400 length:1551 start_codon:yes stop_codon:yes gene_type:complete